MLGNGVSHAALFVHDGIAYEWKSADMDRGLRVFNAFHHDTAPGADEAQMIMVNAGYVAAKDANPEGRDWVVTQLERKDGLWRASEKKKWKHTLDVLRGDHDEDLVVAPAEEQMVKNLKSIALVQGYYLALLRPPMPEELSPLWTEWSRNDAETTVKRWERWLESDEGKAAVEKRRAEEEAKAHASPWGGPVVLLGEKRKATEEPERTS